MWAKPASPTSESAGTPPRRDSVAVKNFGRRFAQIVKLKPEFIDKYKEVHAAVWPEVLQQIKACNIQDCKSTTLRVSKLPHPSRLLHFAP